MCAAGFLDFQKVAFSPAVEKIILSVTILSSALVAFFKKSLGISAHHVCEFLHVPPMHTLFRS